MHVHLYIGFRSFGTNATLTHYVYIRVRRSFAFNLYSSPPGGGALPTHTTVYFRAQMDDEMFGDVWTGRLLGWTRVNHVNAQHTLHNEQCADFVKRDVASLSATIAQHRSIAPQLAAWGKLFGDLDRLGANAATCGALSGYKCAAS